MKQSVLLLFLYSSFGVQAQCALFPIHTEYSDPAELTQFQSFTAFNFMPESLNETSLLKLNYVDGMEQVVPKPPVLTTESIYLEVCEGNSTTLTALSDYPIEWYTSYPPEGEPVGRGNRFVTPTLDKGYYIYHAVANNNGVKSASSEMEVVMVYPLPFIQIVNTATSICAGETTTLSAFGTRFYSWNTGETSNEIIIQAKQTFTYKVTGMNTAGCKRTESFTQVVENCESQFHFSGGNTSLAKSSEKGILSSIYPNPNNGEFQVKINSISEFTRIEVYNSFGELVFSTKALGEQTTVNLSQANKGIYTLRILEQNQVLKQEKVLIEN